MCSDGDTPGYSIEESEASTASRACIVGDGRRLRNQGQKTLNLAAGNADLNTMFQIANVSPPIVSVGKTCDGGLRIALDDNEAVVTNKQGNVVFQFLRQTGGLCSCQMILKRPKPNSLLIFKVLEDC